MSGIAFKRIFVNRRKIQMFAVLIKGQAWRTRAPASWQVTRHKRGASMQV